MKYAIALLLGILCGAVLFVVGMYVNPFVENVVVSPLAVTRTEQLDFTFTAVPGESVLYTDHGESIVKTHPNRVAELWESTVVDTRISVIVFNNRPGEVAGLGIKFSTNSEQTSPIYSKALVNSAWHVYVPGEGTMFVDQVENYWSYLREIVLPARWSSGDNWKGAFFGVMTHGPNALGTGRMTGGTGNFAGISGEAVETLTAQAYSANDGLVSAVGGLTVSLPQTTGDTE